jgi:hypothetical protein
MWKLPIFCRDRSRSAVLARIALLAQKYKDSYNSIEVNRFSKKIVAGSGTQVRGRTDMALMVIKNANLALRFLLELCALVALGYWGFRTGSGLLAKIGLGIGVPLLTVVIWGAFVAPNAAVHLPEPVPFILGLFILELAAAALAAAERLAVAVAFGVIVVINAVLMVIWRQ